MPFSLLGLNQLDFRTPYIQREFLIKRCSMRTFRKSGGIYFIKENGILVYIGMSRKTLQSTLYRHFQKWTDNRSSKNIPYMNPPYRRVSYHPFLDEKIYEVAAIPCEESKVFELEKAYIRKYQPRDNSEKYEYASRHEEPLEPYTGEVPEEREACF